MVGATKLGKEHYSDFFIAEVMNIISQKIKEESSKPYINQNQAFKRFGRSNVEKWAKMQKVKQFFRDKTVQYRMSELLDAASNQQDYLYKL